MAIPPDVVPTVDEVAVLVHSRTLEGGSEAGTFNDDTEPTGDQVLLLIAQAVADVASSVALAIPAAYADEARRLAALRAAILVEASFFPAQLDTDRSAARQYTAMYLAAIQTLTDNVRHPTALRLR